jgi:hypothetical protein
LAPAVAASATATVVATGGSARSSLAIRVLRCGSAIANIAWSSARVMATAAAAEIRRAVRERCSWCGSWVGDIDVLSMALLSGRTP